VVAIRQLRRDPFPLQDLAVAGAGFVPIACLCAAVFGVLPLSLTARWVVPPLTMLVVATAVWDGELGARAVRGFLAGLAATAAYDLVRLGLVLSGAWADFIPAIGRMALEDPAASPVWGYLWRYVYDGGAMGVTFAVLRWRGVRAGLAFGAAVCACLLCTLMAAPGAQQAMFRLGPVTAACAMTGHLIYGAVLGGLVDGQRRHRGGKGCITHATAAGSRKLADRRVATRHARTLPGPVSGAEWSRTRRGK
jgi:hypothetical protein